MSRQENSRVCIVYPADPLGVIPGGIDTFIRGILRWAPSDIRINVVGITTDEASRPVGQWTACHLGDRTFQFYPVLALKSSERQARFPVTLRFLLALMRRKLSVPADVLEFHRVEPCLAFFRDRRPKTLVMHQNMKVLRHADSDIRWKYSPKLYFMLEDILLPRMSTIYCVRDDAAASYRERFPESSNRIHFTPTWVDTEIFQPPSVDGRRQGRESLNKEFGFADSNFVLVTVGRLDKQKNPLLLVDGFALLHRKMPDARLMFVGDGVLRGQIEDRIAHFKLESEIKLCGVRSASEVSRYLQGSDTFVLSSAYEGMPICVLEALGSGLPVVSTDVGEVARVVRPEINGALVARHDAEALANAIAQCRRNIEQYRGKPCSDAVQDYTPQKVLKPIFENYRRLAFQRIE